MKYLVGILMMGSLCLLSSCSKDDAPPGPTHTELIVSSTWKYNTSGVDVNNDGFIDAPAPQGYILDCDKDNTLTFKSDGTGTLDEGASKCDPTNPQSSPYTWSFRNGETYINFPIALMTGFNGDVKILKLTSTELNLSKEVNIGLPNSIYIVVQLKH